MVKGEMLVKGESVMERLPAGPGQLCFDFARNRKDTDLGASRRSA